MNFKAEDIKNLNSQWPMPTIKKKIVIIGAGGIVSDAHLPAYKKANYEILGIYDLKHDKAKKCALDFGIPKVYQSIDEALNEKDVVLDIAVPPKELLEIVKKIPQNSICQLQKPVGNSLEDAREIKKIIRKKNIIACVNLQLKFSPMMLALKDAIDKKIIGNITELEVNLSVATPWNLWPFMQELENCEVPLHSIHYLDWIRSLLGEPKSVFCKSVNHPNFPKMNDARSSIILEYQGIRCCLSLNHTHNILYGKKHSHAYARVEGINGAAFVKLGLLLDYPKGEPEEIEISNKDIPWTKVKNIGSWFPDAFINTMSSLQRFAAGEDKILPHSVDDAFNTMSLVYACLESNSQLGTLLKY